MSFSTILKSLCDAFTDTAEAPKVTQPPKPATLEEEREKFFGAIHWSAKDALTAIVQKYPDALEWRNAESEKPLYIAMKNNRLDTFRFLIDLGADPNQRDVTRHYIGEAPILSVAGKEGKEEFVQLLLERGADPRARDKDGRTPETWTTSSLKNFAIADMILRGDQIRAEYLASQAAQPTPAPASVAATTPGETSDDITVRGPLKLKNARTPV